MCGLVGCAGNLELKDEKVLKKLLLVDVFRGLDSTGVAALRTNGDVKTSKISSHPLDLFQMPSFNTVVNGALSTAFIGHNRSATRGSVNTFNAHPFTFGHITGAHNGTLMATSTGELEEAIGEKFPVDSMAIFAGFEKLGVPETLKLMREGGDMSSGAWSLTWVNTEEATLNFLRNKWRPMYLSYSKKLDKLYWASEWQMIEFATRSEGIELWADDKGMKYFATEVDQHYKFDLNDFLGADPLPKPVITERKGKEPFTAAKSGNVAPFPRPGVTTTSNQTGVGTSGTRPSTSAGSGGSTTSGTSRTNSTTTTSRSPTNIDLEGDELQPMAGLISFADLEGMIGRGCSFCSKPIKATDKGLTVIERCKAVLCPECGGFNAVANRSLPNKIYLPNLKQSLGV